MTDYQTIKEENRALNFREIREGRSHLKSKPLFFWFDINGPCNLECSHCGFNIYGRTSDQEVSERIYQQVMTEVMPTAFTCLLGGTNWGEMTIAKGFHRFLLDCKKYGVKVSLTTNGTRMVDEWFDDLMDTLTVVGFSMEGMGEEFEKIRGFKWQHFVKNVEKLSKGRAARKKDFKIEWRYCAHADSIHQLDDMIRTAHDLGVDSIQIMNLKPWVKSQQFKSLYYHRGLANEHFAKARKTAQALNFDVHIPPDFNLGTWDTSNLIQIGKAGKGKVPAPGLEMINCFKPWQALSINELGVVKPCCVYWRPYGSLATSSFDSIWNGRKYRRLRESVNDKPDAICHSCRLPRFDSEDNPAASVLKAGVREQVEGLVSATFERRPRVSFAGVMDEEFAPMSSDRSATTF